MDKRDVIDFSALERELHAAVESAHRHERENEAKLRAVSQRVSYSQFRYRQVLEKPPGVSPGVLEGSSKNPHLCQDALNITFPQCGRLIPGCLEESLK